MTVKYTAEPFRIKMVERIKMLSGAERETAIKAANYNLFNLLSEDVYIDLLTDSGTNAMSDDQWAGLAKGDESYAGGRSYFKLLKAAKDIFDYQFIQPVHQGRAAEKILFPILLKTGDIAISNTFFDTTRAHVELSGARAFDCMVPEAKDPMIRSDFKGNMDVENLETLIQEYGERVKLVVITITNNSAGGQPVSIDNIRAVSAICKKYRLPLNIDAARYAENAYFIKQREEEFKNSDIKDIIKTLFTYADTFTMSAKKDTVVNMGGLLGVKSDEILFQQVKERCISYEGFTTYGGLSGRDLEALAIGLYEGIEESYLRYRIGQLEYLASRLDEAGIVYQSPVGGHGVFVDAKALFPHIPYHQFPAQALAIELYKEAGIRTCDIGSYMLGNDPDTGEQLQSAFEFTRFAIPRRVYTQAHIDIMADALIAIKTRASQVKGYKITWEPSVLRHFQAHLLPVN